MYKDRVMKSGLLFLVLVSQYLFAALPVTNGLVIHLDAGSITGLSAGDLVATWSDLSGGGNNATQTVIDSQPTYIASSVAFGGNPTIYFDGADDFLDFPSGSSCPINVTSFTVLIVAQYGKIDYQDIISAQGASGNDRIRMQIDTAISGSPFHWMAGNSPWKAIQTTSDTDVHVFGITSTVEGFLDGTSIATASSTAVATDIPSDFVLGAAAGGAGGYLSGEIAEVVVYDRVLTETEIADMTEFFVSKYLLDEAIPVVDAGPSMATWLGYLPQVISGTVVDDDVELDGIDWSIISSPAGSNPVLTPTTTNPYTPTAQFTTDVIGDYAIQLTAADQLGQTVSDMAVMSVTENACEAARLIPNWDGFSIYDTDENCTIDLDDFAVFALEWLADSRLETPQPMEATEIKTMAIIGDSTVCIWPTSSDKRGWGQYIQEYFQSSAVLVVNNAKSGRSTKTFIEEGLWADTLAINPAYVLIQFGHNDSHDPSYPESTDAETDYKEYLRQYIDESRAIGAVPVLITPMYRRVFDDLGNLEDNLVPYATAMKSVAVEKSVPVIDLNAASAELYLNLGPDGCLTIASSSTDPTHFNEAGARAMAELVMEQLPVVEPGLEPLLK